jgi:two-component system CheB/CheR fusion protein
MPGTDDPLRSAPERRLELRVLIAAPAACDTEVLCRVLEGAGIETTACADPEALCSEIDRGGGAAVLAEEVLAPRTQRLLAETLLRQPEWSDFPLIVMGAAERVRAAHLLDEVAGCTHAVVLQRPVRKFTLVSAARAALQARLRQYQVRDELARWKQSEAARRESESRFRQLADAMPQLVWTADANGRVDYFNRRLADFAVVGHEADGSWRWQDLIEPEDLARSQEAWQSILKRAQPYQIEHRMRMADGSCRWHLTRSMPVCDAVNRIVKWFGTCTDIHDLKVAHQALDEANRRKDEFLATLAHELRNPLAPIGNAVELLKLHGSPDSILETARDTIDRQLQHMVRLIDDLLDVSRITRGKLQLRRECVTLGTVLEQALEASRPHLEQSGHEIELSLPREAVYLDADPVRLSQVLLNLINNACKYTPRGGRISLSVSVQGEDVEVCVTDTGIGIPPEFLPGVFEMFSQDRSTAGQSAEGLGIGLALAKGVVDMHGGSIEAYSEGRGRGSEFRVKLTTLRDKVRSQALSDGEGAGATTGAGRRVLIADDNPDIVGSLAMVLELNGHAVETACDGLDAVRTAERCRPEVVLLDIGMPGVDGYGACRRIREQGWGRDMQIIALTGWGQDEDRRRAGEAGFDAHLVKPVDVPALLRLLSGEA